MSLRLQLEKDLGHILEDKTSGFGWDIVLIDPENNNYNFVGFSNDISQVIDPETGMVLSGRTVSVALKISSILESGMKMPKGVEDSSSKPWLVQFKDINGSDYMFKVSKSNPDRAIGILTCLLESYQ